MRRLLEKVKGSLTSLYPAKRDASPRKRYGKLRPAAVNADLRAGMSYAAIAKKRGLSYSTVYNYANGVGWYAGKCQVPKDKLPKRWRMDRAAVEADRAAGMSYAAIARKHGLARSTVYNYLNGYGGYANAG